MQEVNPIPTQIMPEQRSFDPSRSRSFLIWGAGGHGRMVGDLLQVLGERLEGYVDRDPTMVGSTVDPIGAPVRFAQAELLSSLEAAGRCPEGVTSFALGVGDNRSREECLRRLGGFDVPALVHPSAIVSPSARIGRGSVVLPRAVVNAGASIGEAVIVNSGAIVEHDCRLDSGVHVSPGAILCGGVRVGSRTWIGAGATVIHELTVGRDAIVGAGSTVIADVADGVTVVGNPARIKGSSGVRQSDP